ncbi:MAG TPA: SIMPL domain-containing protein, partial [Polyangiales bacterium]|nr:SIMPL domain-containing protein [Polyangiales bacterium]
MTVSKLLLSTALLAAAGCSHTTVRAVMPNPNEPAHGITVSGQGEAKGVPDIARANMGVEVRAETAEQATADVNGRMAAVIAALKQAGVADKDLRTSNLSIGFEQDPQPPVVVMPQPAPARGKVAAEAAPQPAPESSAIRGHYRATNMVEATIRDMSSIGRVLKLATDAGANNVWGIQFEIEDPQPLRAQARTQAIERAKQNAQELARLSGVKLGKLVSISESDGGGYQPMM